MTGLVFYRTVHHVSSCISWLDGQPRLQAFRQFTYMPQLGALYEQQVVSLRESRFAKKFMTGPNGWEQLVAQHALGIYMSQVGVLDWRQCGSWGQQQDE